MRDQDDERLARYEDERLARYEYDYERGSVPARGDAFDESTPVRGLVSFFSSNEREGRWELPRHFRVLAVLGTSSSICATR